MKDIETTNLLLLLILLVLLAGFGFLLPILWIVAGIVGLWLLSISLSAAGRALARLGKGFESVVTVLEKFLFAPISAGIGTVVGNSIVQWLFIALVACFAAWQYIQLKEFQYVLLLFLPSVLTLFKTINLLDDYLIRRKLERKQREYRGDA